MIAYTKDEIMPVTQIARNLHEVLNKLKKRTLRKVAISRNNVLESIILPVEEYELLQEVYDLAEQLDIFQVVKEREKTDLEEFIPLEQVLMENDSL